MFSWGNEGVDLKVTKAAWVCDEEGAQTTQRWTGDIIRDTQFDAVDEPVCLDWNRYAAGSTRSQKPTQVCKPHCNSGVERKKRNNNNKEKKKNINKEKNKKTKENNNKKNTK
ncbi:hypothetical protein EYF80_018079 [Liparis tanakae]|uniref:Uncharacterized protein n=1 Tax=Liparis tanakae TaxID=230148 RepID=A0A4Z2I1C9_9TELE|nr:hypothetical protein EYF80_018079 [Liparis tanakae]